jgi:uncharacterized membrane protein
MNNKFGIVAALIISFIYALIFDNYIYKDILALIATIIGVLLLPIIISCFSLDKYNFGTKLFWSTLILTILSGIGRSL